MTSHRHHTPGRALRLLLADLRDVDGLDGYNILISECAGCSFCGSSSPTSWPA